MKTALKIQSLCYKCLSNNIDQEGLKYLSELFDCSWRTNMKKECEIELSIIEQFSQEIVTYDYIPYRNVYYNKFYTEYKKKESDSWKNYNSKWKKEQEEKEQKFKEYMNSLVIPEELKNISTRNLLRTYREYRFKSYYVHINDIKYHIDVIKKELDGREHLKRKNTIDGCNVNGKTKFKKFKNQKK